MNKAQLIKRYTALKEDVKTNKFYTNVDLTNRVNCYVCAKCKHITKTKDVDAGVTPFMHLCEKCSNNATSTFFKDIVPMQAPTQEWYRPSLTELLQMFNKIKFAPHKEGIIEHVLRGGLLVRNIKPQPTNNDVVNAVKKQLKDNGYKTE